MWPTSQQLLPSRSLEGEAGGGGGHSFLPVDTDDGKWRTEEHSCSSFSTYEPFINQTSRLTPTVSWISDYLK